MSDPTSTFPVRFAEGTTRLAAQDPVITALVAETGPIVFTFPPESNYAALARSITYQQLAGAAATAIYRRVEALVDEEVTPERMAALSRDQLLSAGLSHAKAASILDLTAKAMDGTVVLDDAGLAAISDDEVVQNLVQVRGIGEWTAQVFTMIHLGRPDVLPTGDLGIRKGYGLGWKAPIPTPAELELIGDQYRPYRSVFSWYCWRAAEKYGHSSASAIAGAR